MPATVELLTQQVSVRPGDSGSITVRLVNTGRIVDELTMEVIGAPAAWSTVQPATLPLFPGATGQATIVFTPPRGPQPAAGSYVFGLRVRSREDRTFSFVAEGRVEVAVLMDVAARISPRTSTGGRLSQGSSHRVDLDNNSNVAATVRLSAADPDERLTFAITPPVVAIPPGGHAQATVRASGRQRVWNGTPNSLPFQVIAAPDGAAPIPLDGTMSQRATLVFGITQVAAVVISLGVVAALGLAASQTLLKPPETPAPSAAATPTLAALATPGPTPAPTPTPTPTPAPSSPPPSSAPPASSAAPPVSEAPTSPPPTVTEAPTSPPPTVTPSPTPSVAPIVTHIFNLGLTDPAAAIPAETPVPSEEPTPTPAPGATFIPPVRPLPSWIPVASFVVQGEASGRPVAMVGSVGEVLGPVKTQDEPQLPVQQFALQVNGPVSASIQRVSDNSSPRICLTPENGEDSCRTDGRPVVDVPKSATTPLLRFLSVVAQQANTTVDIDLRHSPQAATLFFRNVHLAGGMAPAGMEMTVQATATELLIVAVNELSTDGVVTVAITDLTAAPQVPLVTSTLTPGIATYVATLPGHLYRVQITGSSDGELFASGSISWP